MTFSLFPIWSNLVLIKRAEDVHGTYVSYLLSDILCIQLKAGSKPKQCKKEEAALAMNVSCSLSASPMS